MREMTCEEDSCDASKAYHDGRKLRSSCSGLDRVMDDISISVHILSLTLRPVRVRPQSIRCGSASSSVSLQGHRLC